MLPNQVRQGQLQGGHRGEALLQREQQLRVHLCATEAMLKPNAGCSPRAASGSMFEHARQLLPSVQPARVAGCAHELLHMHRPARLWPRAAPRSPRKGWHRGSLHRVPRDPLALPTRPADPLPPGVKGIVQLVHSWGVVDMGAAVLESTMRLVRVEGAECCAYLQQESEEGHTGVVNTTPPPGAVYYSSKIPYRTRLLPATPEVLLRDLSFHHHLVRLQTPTPTRKHDIMLGTRRIPGLGL